MKCSKSRLTSSICSELHPISKNMQNGWFLRSFWVASAVRPAMWRRWLSSGRWTLQFRRKTRGFYFLLWECWSASIWWAWSSQQSEAALWWISVRVSSMISEKICLHICRSCRSSITMTARTARSWFGLSITSTRYRICCQTVWSTSFWRASTFCLSWFSCFWLMCRWHLSCSAACLCCVSSWSGSRINRDGHGRQFQIRTQTWMPICRRILSEPALRRYLHERMRMRRFSKIFPRIAAEHGIQQFAIPTWYGRVSIQFPSACVLPFFCPVWSFSGREISRLVRL